MVVTYINLKKRIVSTEINFNNELSDILNHVSEFTGVAICTMKGRKRKREFSDARHIYLVYAYNNSHYGMESVAKEINRSHALIYKAKDRTENKYEIESYFNSFKLYMENIGYEK